MSEQRLLLISRDDILRVADTKQEDRLFRLLARLVRSGFQLLVTAPQPDEWSSDHGGPDDALLGPDSLRKRISDAGGVIDGVYYVRRSSLTQRRRREEALQDMLSRYGISTGNCYLFSSSRKFVRAAVSLGIHATRLNAERTLMNQIKPLERP